MSLSKETKYAEELASMIAIETVSTVNQPDKSKFHRFHQRLRELFPALFATCEYTEMDGSFFLRWNSGSNDEPIMLMNHHDVVEATGDWKYPPFSGTVAEDRVWGRGALDTKGGLWAMLRAAEELAAETGADVVCVIGRKTILYRESVNHKKIEL